MKKAFLITSCLVFLISCSENESNENQDQLKEKYHGKYELISSISEEAVDLDMDGIASTDLLSENPAINNSSIELRIFDGDTHFFEEKWPVETIVIPQGETFDSTSFHPNYSIYYALYINPSSCRFDGNNESIQLLEECQKNETNTLINFESITIEENETIKVVTIRNLYTIKGWVTTTIESRYKRYTTLT